jgi:hypothetical protein
VSGLRSLGKLEVSLRGCGLLGFISGCYLRAVFLFGAGMGENVGGLSVSPELFRECCRSLRGWEAALTVERNVGVLPGA